MEPTVPTEKDGNLPIFPIGKGETMEYCLVGLHTTRLPYHVPEFSVPTSMRPYDIYYHSYIYDNYVWAAFLPDPLDIPNATLACLRYTKSTFPVEKITDGPKAGCFRLCTDLVQKWDDLFGMLQSLKKLLVTMVERFPFSVPLNIREPAPPTHYGYNRIDDNESRLRKIAVAAKASFFYNMAFISYLVAMCSSSEDLHKPWPFWVDFAVRNDLIKPTVWNALHSTWIIDLRVRRKGAFVNVMKGSALFDSYNSTQWFADIQHLTKTLPNMPFWFRYTSNKIPDGAQYNLARKYLPADDAVNKAWGLILAARLKEIQPDEPHTPQVVTTYPEMRGAKFPEFIHQLYSFTQYLMNSGSPERKKSLEDRMLAQSGHPCPSEGVPAVFRWVLEYDGSWTSYAVSRRRGQVQELWDESMPFQRYYDPYRNVYHVSIYAEPGDIPGTENVQPFPSNISYDLEDEWELEDGEFDNQTLVISSDHLESTRRRRSASPQRGVAPLYRHQSDLPIPSSSRQSRSQDRIDDFLEFLQAIPTSLLYTPRIVECVRDPPAVMLEQRYGVNIHANHAISPGMDSTEGLETQSSAELMLGCLKDEQSHGAYIRLAQVFFAAVVEERPIPAGLCDVGSATLVENVRHKEVRNLTISKLTDSFYLLDSKLNGWCLWVIVMRHATSVLEVLRRSWGPNNDSIVIELLKRGIPFHTMVLEHVIPPPQPQFITFDIFPFNHQPTVDDYHAYELRRQTLLSGPRGRAALMMGGIVWRLAREVMYDYEILDGPNYCSGPSFQISTSSGTLVDNALTSDELAVLCGTYKILTVRGTSGESTSSSSWWPSHEVWDASAYNFGYWTPRNEEWYQNRLSQIYKGDAGVLTTTAWKKAVKGHRRGRTMRTNYEVLAERSLDALIDLLPEM